MLQSSITSKNFSNSKQKEDGLDYGITLKAKMNRHTLELLHSGSNVNTLQPPLPDDLEVSKNFVRYSYNLNPSHTLSLSYMNINDNIAPTDDGEIYGLKYFNRAMPHWRIALAHYESRYHDFKVQQNDLSAQYHTQINGVILDATAMLKHITLDGYRNAIFNPMNLSDSEDSYTTLGFKLHGAYKGWHGAMGAWLGKRMFAVMSDGYGVQHHAMEFERTYFMGVGKKFNNLNVMFKYSYQEATELPQNNPNVEVDAFTLMLSYKF